MKKIIFILLLVSICGIAYSSNTLVNQGEIKGRTYHADMYKGKDKCVDCHGTSSPVTYPSDETVCAACHDINDLAIISTRPDNDKMQNPHDNFHYGKDSILCTECHGEHVTKKPLCSSCHNYDYSKHKN